MIDLHCHLDLYPDPGTVVARCVELRMYVLSVTTVPSAFEGTAALVPADSRIRTALGFHPQLAAARAQELILFERLLPRTRYVGEIGLDASREHRATLDVQRGIFAEVLGLCARAGGKLLSLHSRGATGILLDSLAVEPGAGRAVLHWYVGSAKHVARAVDMGCWFSIGPAMLASARGRAAALAMPRERVIPESDGPFGSIEGRSLLPWDAWSVVPKLTELWNEPEDVVEARLIGNFRNLLA